MKIVVDSALCTGHGQCYAVAPEVYRADEEGYNADVGQTVDVPAGQEEQARKGANLCPESAILTIDEG